MQQLLPTHFTITHFILWSTKEWKFYLNQIVYGYVELPYVVLGAKTKPLDKENL